MCLGLPIRISSVSPNVLWFLYAEEFDFILPLSCFVAYMPHCTGIYSLLLCLENFSIRIHIYEKEKNQYAAVLVGQRPGLTVPLFHTTTQPGHLKQTTAFLRAVREHLLWAKSSRPNTPPTVPKELSEQCVLSCLS